MKNLVLTGFMGVGKTTAGKLVAEKLGRPFVDTDEIITQRVGKSVPQIFAEEGEPYFRELEAALCVELSTPQGLVISTGGGTLVPENNLKAIGAGGNVVIYLSASLEGIFYRLINDQRGRPLVDNHPNRLEAAMTLLQNRREAYGRIPLHIDTTDCPPERVAQDILDLFQRELAHDGERITVQTPDGQYDILLGGGLLAGLGDVLRSYQLGGRVVVATDTDVAPLYGEKLVASLPNATLVTMPSGEHHKNLDTVRQLYADFAAAGLDRGGLVIALGGGVVGDTVGYAAASYMRGVRLVQVPTTLLAMVDSSVGGKVGVDIPEGKNLVGAFKQPELVIIDPHVLGSLPAVEVRCGLAEAIKHALISDPGLLEQVEAIASGDPAALRRTIAVKVGVVQRDPFEQGERAHLNLGHTFAHAIERVSGYSWRHGEAVGVGLVAAARLSQKIGKLSADQAAQVCQIVAESGLPTTLNGFTPQALWEAMGTDKKWRDGHSQFVVLADIGKVALVRDIPRQVVLDVLASLA